jgi:polysaccharide export outer membrane protein
MKRFDIRLILTFFICFFLSTSCSLSKTAAEKTEAEPNADMVASTEAFPSQEDGQSLRLAPGDNIEVKFHYWPELDDVQNIRPDGKISLQLIDEVTAAGKTPEELDQLLTDLYESKLKHPEITVVVRSLVHQNVYVGGEVLAPRMIPYTADMTVMDAIISAGGFIKESAHVENVVVLRHKDGQRFATSVNVREIIEHSDSDPFYLSHQDIVYVPRTKIDRLNQWIDQYITKVIPDLPFVYTRNLSQWTRLGYSQ